MRYTNLLPLAAALATAVVIPDDATAQQLSLEVEKPAENAEKTAWWDSLHSAHEATRDFIDKKAHGILDHVDHVVDIGDSDDLFAFGKSNEDHHHGPPDHHGPPGPPGHHGPPGRHGPPGYHGSPIHHGTTNLTVYEAIQSSNFTKKFAALINDFPDVIELLNTTDTNVTVFVPLDTAFERIPDHKPPKEIIEKIIQYHILPGYYPAGRVLTSHTVPTALKSKALGDQPQRLRVSPAVFGLKLNFYSRVTILNLFAKNGVAHGVNSILIPPPPVPRTISLLPSTFSTLELAARKTGLLPTHPKDGDEKSAPHHHYHGHANLTGLTVFAPSNRAFARLGPAANAFLFNTDRGLGYLRALLKYHVVANQTLYSDAYYGLKGRVDDPLPMVASDEDSSSEDEGRSSSGNGHFHIDMPTLLGKNLAVDIARWYGFIRVRVNGHLEVVVEDGVCLDGVLQIMDAVIFPPRKGMTEGSAWTEADGEMAVEDLVERLAPYVDEEGEKDVDAGKDQTSGEL